MTVHATHPAIIKRLKRAAGHLNSIVAMLERGRECLEITQQLQAVENAIGTAKKTLIHDHIDHCLEHAVRGRTQPVGKTVREFKAISRYL